MNKLNDLMVKLMAYVQWGSNKDEDGCAEILAALVLFGVLLAVLAYAANAQGTTIDALLKQWF